MRITPVNPIPTMKFQTRHVHPSFSDILDNQIKKVYRRAERAS